MTDLFGPRFTNQYSYMDFDFDQGFEECDDTWNT